MARSKIAVTIDETTLRALDDLVRDGAFPNRSRGIETALQEHLKRLARTRLARECAKLNPEYEQQLAEEGMSWQIEEWPEY